MRAIFVSRIALFVRLMILLALLWPCRQAPPSLPAALSGFMSTTKRPARSTTAPPGPTPILAWRQALAAAALGTEIWVAEGTYTPRLATIYLREFSFALKNGVAVYGGFAGRRLSAANAIGRRTKPF